MAMEVDEIVCNIGSNDLGMALQRGSETIVHLGHDLVADVQELAKVWIEADGHIEGEKVAGL